jgi:hypothetical protein
MRSVLALILGLALLPACATQSDYLNNRGADVADILRGKLMFGPGIGIKAEATRVLHAGILYSRRAFAIGLGNREAGTWRESVLSWGALVGYHDEYETEPIPYLSGSYGWNFAGGDDGGVFETSGHGGALDLLTFRLSAMLVIGFDIELRVGEIIDFFAGIAQFDPSGDDVEGTYPIEEIEEVEEPAEPEL